MNKLIINRRKEQNNRGKGYKIFINDNYEDSIEDNSNQKILFFESDTIDIEFKIDWCSSKKTKIDFTRNTTQEITVYSSIPNYLWYFIVIGILLLSITYFILFKSIFMNLAFIIVLIPIYKVTIGKNNYLKVIKE